MNTQNGFTRPVIRSTNTNEFQIRGVGYTTREYCESKGIIDKDQIKRIQWRINKYTHTHTKEETTNELIRLVSLSQRQEKIGGTLTRTTEGIRPWQGAKKERIIAQQEKETRKSAAEKMITQQQNGETATKEIDQRELLKQSKWMNTRSSDTTTINAPQAKDGIQITIYDNISTLPQANGNWPNENHHPPKTEDRLLTAYKCLKHYTESLETVKTIQNKIDTLEAELKDAQKEVEKWSTTAAALLRDV